MEVCELEMSLTHWSCITYKICGSILGTSSHIQVWLLDHIGNCLIWSIANLED